ncbi:hypothetical protein ACFLV0_07635 [Chloroflexota bacterium]
MENIQRRGDKEMKKSIAIVIIVTLVIGLIAALPVFAKGQPHDVRALFEADLVDQSGNYYGEVWVRDGSGATDWIKVEVEGAAAETTYDVMVFTWGGSFTDIGDLTTDDEGEGMIELNLLSAGTYAGVIFGLHEQGGDVLCASGFKITD